MVSARSGYTLPVFACAAAIAAIQHLRDGKPVSTVTLDLIRPPISAEIAIAQVALLSFQSALAITKSDPGDNLDLTRDTPIWAMVTLKTGVSQLDVIGGEGIGKNQEGQAAIYRYARQLLTVNLSPYLLPDETIEVKIILPEGRNLAERTSNAAFGIVEGLSLLGTTGISQPLSAAQHLETLQQEIKNKASYSDRLIFCVGENGLDLAQKQGFPSELLVKTANWIGPLLVTAAIAGVKQILLFGYHGKLIKLAGGIFHTHHHLADARLEILVAQGVKMGLETNYLQELLTCETTEAALQKLRQWHYPADDLSSKKGDKRFEFAAIEVSTMPKKLTSSLSPLLQAEAKNHAVLCDHSSSLGEFMDQEQTWATPIYQSIADTIDQRSERYIWEQSGKKVQVGSILFDRDRHFITTSETGKILRVELTQSYEM